MQNQNPAKLFAFKLAGKQDKQTKPEPGWKVRDGVSVAGCSGPDGYDQYREVHHFYGADNGIYC